MLCIEVLSHQINEAVEHGRWQDILLSRHEQVLSHLYFAYDLLLFGTILDKQASCMDSIIKKFCGFSRHHVSMEKSELFLSSNVSQILL